MDVVVWLRSLGLGKHEAAFRENDIDELSKHTRPVGSAHRPREPTVAAGASDLRRRGLELGAIAAIATSSRLLGGRLSCAPLPVAGRGHPSLDGGHVARRSLLRHRWAKQQDRQNEELLHGSHPR